MKNIKMKILSVCVVVTGASWIHSFIRKFKIDTSKKSGFIIDLVTKISVVSLIYGVTTAINMHVLNRIESNNSRDDDVNMAETVKKFMHAIIDCKYGDIPFLEIIDLRKSMISAADDILCKRIVSKDPKDYDITRLISKIIDDAWESVREEQIRSDSKMSILPEECPWDAEDLVAEDMTVVVDMLPSVKEVVESITMKYHDGNIGENLADVFDEV